MWRASPVIAKSHIGCALKWLEWTGSLLNPSVSCRQSVTTTTPHSYTMVSLTKRFSHWSSMDDLIINAAEIFSLILNALSVLRNCCGLLLITMHNASTETKRSLACCTASAMSLHPELLSRGRVGRIHVNFSPRLRLLHWRSYWLWHRDISLRGLSCARQMRRVCMSADPNSPSCHDELRLPLFSWSHLCECSQDIKATAKPKLHVWSFLVSPLVKICKRRALSWLTLPFASSHVCRFQQGFDAPAPCLTSHPVIILLEDVFCWEDGYPTMAVVMNFPGPPIIFVVNSIKI